MCNILKTADGRAKRMKMVLGNCLCGVLFMSESFEFRLGLFGALSKMFDLKIFKRLLVPQFSFIQPNLMDNQTIFFVSHEKIYSITFWRDKNMAGWKFVNTVPYVARNFKTLLLQFWSDLIQTFKRTLVTWWNTWFYSLRFKSETDEN